MQPSSTRVNETPQDAVPARTGQGLGSRSAAAWALCALCWCLMFGAFWLIGASVVVQAGGGPLLPAYAALVAGPNPPVLDAVELLLFAATLLAFATLGALIVSRYPANAVGWIFCLLSLFGTGEQFATYYAVFGLIVRPGALPYGLVAAWFTEWSWTIFFGLLSVWLPLLFPNGRPPSRRWRPVVWFALGANILLTLSFALKPGPLGNITLLEQFDSPVRLLAPDGPITIAVLLGFGGILLSMLLALVSVAARLRYATGDEREQLKWFCYPMALLALLFVFQAVFRYIVPLWSSTFERCICGSRYRRSSSRYCARPLHVPRMGSRSPSTRW